MRTRVNFLDGTVMGRPWGRRRSAAPVTEATAAAHAVSGIAHGHHEHTTKRWMLVAARVLGVAALPGCAGYYYGDKYGPTLGSTVDNMLRSNLVEASHRATDALLKTVTLDAQQPVLVTTLVNVDQRSEPSQLGLIVAEQIAGRLVQRGVRVTALKWQEPLAVQQRHPGELLVPREWHEVGQAHDAQAVVVGTYAVSARQLYISLKLVSPAGNAVVAAHDYVVPVDDDVRTLLRGR
jgi:TolB-like protein